MPGDALPIELAERTEALNDRAVHSGGRYVLYWMHHAMRAEENPALDAAIHLALAHGKPLLVLQGVGGGHRYDNDRHLTFALQGARDVHRALAKRKITHVLAVDADRPGPARREDDEAPPASPLRRLAAEAAAIVTEDLPVPPMNAWTRKLATELEIPVWAVDAACVLPMRSVGQAYARAFQFREATHEERMRRALTPWREIDETPKRIDADDLPMRCVPVGEMDDEAIAAFIGQLDIDHTIPAVPHTPGGTAAGYARWSAFRADGLGQYARRRNNAAIDGVSRLSPYLHYGMVSPMRIAREAAASGTKSAEKFLDELLTWRELSYCFCRFTEDVESLDAIPEWARRTLLEHKRDERPAIHTWERMSRGKTGDVLWDAAQRSLLVHGELHNNVRMTWGKAVLQWTEGPAEALRRLIDLNHRYALDGCDPNSCGGILWCFGLFDRPFKPGESVIGTVRPRSTEEHAERLDLEAYEQRVARSTGRAAWRIGVIGAGIAGAIAARTLRDQGMAVTVLDKARGPGGRMSTRRTDDGLTFNHGAQFFTVRDARFGRLVRSWLRDGMVERWEPRELRLGRGDDRQQEEQDARTRFIARPGMNTIVRRLLEDVDVRFGRCATALRFEDGEGWRVELENGHEAERFDALIVTAPADQTADLLRGSAPEFAARAAASSLQPCWAVMAAFEGRLRAPYEAISVEGDGPIAWAARQAPPESPERATPGRALDPWIVHASSAWSREHLDDDAGTVRDAMLAELAAITGREPPRLHSALTHRWRYALVDQAVGETALWDPARRVAAAGDWCVAGRVESAFLSGCAAAGRVLAAANLAGDPRAADAAGPLFE